MKYILNSKCKNFAGMRKQIVKSLMALVAAMTCMSSYAEIVFPEIETGWVYDAEWHYVLTEGTAENGYEWQCKGPGGQWLSTAKWRPQTRVSCSGVEDQTFAYQLYTRKGYATIDGNVDGYCYVDLGLPSGTLWASYNLGAVSPVEGGKFYQWASTAEYEQYSSDAIYEYVNSKGEYTKYISPDADLANADYAQIQASDDAATQKWSSSWQIPSNEQWAELTKNLTWSWTSDYNETGIAGAIGQAKNGAIIFFPAGPNKDGERYYWSRDLSLKYQSVESNQGCMQIISKNVYSNLPNYRLATNREKTSNIRPVVKKTASTKLVPAYYEWCPEVSKRVITISGWKNREFTYNGNYHVAEPIVEDEVFIKENTPDDPDFFTPLLLVKPENKKVGTYTVTASLNSKHTYSDNYILVDKNLTSSYTINEVEVPAWEWKYLSFTYDGSAHGPEIKFYTSWKVKKSNGDYEDVSVKYTIKDENGKVVEEAIMPGTYTATAYLDGEDKSNYGFKSTAKLQETFVIKKKTPVCGSPKSVEDITYDGKSHTPFQVATESSTSTPGHWEYYTCSMPLTQTLSEIFSDYSKFSEKVPTVTNAGNYRTYFIYVPDDDVIYEPNTWSKNSLNFEIKPKEIELIWSPTSKYFEYDGKAKVPTAKFKEGDIVSDDKVNVVVSVSTEAIEPKKEGSYIATATLTGVSKDNYKISSDFETFDFNILQGNIPYDYVFPEIKKDLVYNGKDQDLLIAGTAGSVDGTWMYSSDGGVTFSKEIPTGKNADIYKNITFKFVPKDNNYSEVICSYYSAEIKPKEITFTTHSYVEDDINMTSFVYNGTAQMPVLKEIKGKIGSDKVNVVFVGDAQTNVGYDYSVTAKLTGDDSENYKLATDVVLFRITRKRLSVEWGNTTLIYSSTAGARIPEYKLDGVIDGDEVNIIESGQESKVGGPYTATLKLSKTANYKFNEDISTEVDLYNITTKEFYIKEPTTQLNLTLSRENFEQGFPVTSVKLDGNTCKADVTYTYYTDSEFTKKTTVKDNGADVAGGSPTLGDSENGGKTYYIKAVVAATDKCEGGEATTSFRITNTFGNEVKTPGVKDELPYIGEEQPLYVSKGSSTIDGTFVYVKQKPNTDAPKPSEYTTSIPQAKDVAKWIVKYIFTPDDTKNYSVLSGASFVDIVPAELTITWPKTELTYKEGVAQAPEPVISGAKGTDKITYTVTGKETKVGNGYVATIVLDDDYKNNYTIKSGETTKFSIVPATSALTLSLSVKDWTYGDEPSTPVLTGNDCKGKETYTYYTDKSYTILTSTTEGASTNGGVPTNAGTYYVKATVAATGTCEAGSATTSFSIAKKNVSITELPTIASPKTSSVLPDYTNPFALVYNGEKQTLIKDGKGKVDGEFVYSVSVDGGDYTKVSGLPTATAAGIYIVKYQFVPTDKNYNTVESKDVIVVPIVDLSKEIVKAPEAVKAVYDGDPHKMATEPTYAKNKTGKLEYSNVGQVETNFSEDIPTQTAVGAGNGVYLRYVLTAGGKTFNICHEQMLQVGLVSSIPLQSKITEAPTSITVTMKGWTYGDKPNAPVISGNNCKGKESFKYYTDASYKTLTSSTDGAETDGGVPTYAGTYYLQANVSATDDCEAATSSTSFKISKQTPKTFKQTPAQLEKIVYNGGDQELIIAGEVSEIKGVFKYAYMPTLTTTLKDEDYVEDKIPTGKNVGIYYSKSMFIPNDKRNYDTLRLSHVSSIIPAKLTVTWPKTELEYVEGVAQAPEPVISGTQGTDKITYTVTGKATKVGDSYEAKIVLDEPYSNNYSIVKGETTPFSIVSVTTGLSLTLSVEGWTYGDTPNGPVLKGNDCKGKETYTYYTDESCTKPTSTSDGAAKEGEVPTYAGTYYVKATVAASGSCEAGSKIASFVIKQAKLTVTWGKTKLTYKEGVAQAPEPTISGAVGSDVITYTVSGKETKVGNGYEAAVVLGEPYSKNYTIVSGKTTSFSIQPASHSVTLSLYVQDWTYGNTTSTPEVEGNECSGKETITYFTDKDLTVKTTSDNGASAEGMKPTKPGTYYVKLDVAASELCAAGSATTSFTIAKRPITVEWGPTELIYTAKEQAPKATLDGVLSNDVVTPAISGKQINVSAEGEFYVASVTLSGRSADYYILTGDVTTNYIIKKGTASDYKEPVAKEKLKYNGEPQELVEEGVCGNIPGIFKYALGVKGNFSTSVPSVTDAGEYVVGYQFIPTDPNIANSDTVYIKVNVDQVPCSFEWGKTELVYNGQEQAPSADIIGKIGSDVVSAVISGKETNVGKDYEAVATLGGLDAKNYYIADKDNAKVKFSIVMSDAYEFKKPTASENLTYDGTPLTLIKEVKTTDINGTYLYGIGEKAKLSSTLPTATNAGEYLVAYKFIPEDAGYYPSDTLYVSTKIAKRDPDIQWLNKQLIYTGSAQKPTATLNNVVENDKDKVTVAVTGAQTKVGNGYIATATLNGDAAKNYEISKANETTEYSIVADKIEKPVITQLEYTYEAKEIEFVKESKYYVITGKNVAIEPGTYHVNIVPSSGYVWSDGTNDAIEKDFVIKKRSVEIPLADTKKYIYTGNSQTYELQTSADYKISGNKQTAAGEYVVTVSLKDPDHCEWNDKTIEDKTYPFVISKAIVKLPMADSVLTYIYDGVEKSFDIIAAIGSTVSEENAVGTDAGEYVRTITLNNEDEENVGYIWEDKTTGPKTLKFVIKPQPVIIPVVTETYFIYTGKPFKFEVPEDTAKVKRYTINMESEEEIGPGLYTATLVLKNNKNYVWADNTIDDRTIEFEIGDGRIAKPDVKISYPYTGNEIVFAASTSAYKVEGGKGTDAGTYPVVITLKGEYTWLDGSTTPMELNVKIIEKPIDKPVLGTSDTYDGTEKYQMPLSEFYDIEGDTFGIDPGKYKTILVLKKNYMWSDSTKSNLVYNFEINKIVVDVPASDPTEFVYNGEVKTYKITANPNYTISNNTQVKAGAYTVVVSLENSKYYKWSDNTESDKTYKFVIARDKVPAPVAVKSTFEYDGESHKFEIVENEKYVIDALNASARKVGVYKRKVSLLDSLNYVWTDGTSADKYIPFEIIALSVEMPTVVTEYKYTGQPIEFVKESDAYTVTNRVQTDAGIYDVKIVLNAGHAWKDGSTDDKEFTVEIKSIDAPKPEIVDVDFIYDGTTHSFGFTPNDGYTIIGDTAAKEPGVYNVTVNLNKNYIWDDDTTDDIEYVFTISKVDVAIPVANTTKFIYNGKEQEYAIVIPEDSLFVVSNNVKKNAGNYIVKASLKDSLHYQWSDSTTFDKEYDFTINKAKVQLPTAPLTNFIFDGTKKDLVVNPSDLYLVNDSNSYATATGKYIRTATLKDKDNYIWNDETDTYKSIIFTIGDGTLEIPEVQEEYEYTGDSIIFISQDGSYSVLNGAKREVGEYKVVVVPNKGYRWSDGTDDPKVFVVVIKPIMIEKPELQLEYTYVNKVIDFKVPVNAAYEITGETSAKDLGKYKVTLELLPNYMWSDSTLGNVSYVFSINKKVIAIPEMDSTIFVYNGKRQTYNIAKSTDYNVLGNVQAYAGSYEVSVLLTDFTHSIWADSTTEVKTYLFNIERAKVDLPEAVQSSFSYDGTTKYFVVTENSRYEVLPKNASASEIGTYERTVTLKDTLNYIWADGTLTDKKVEFTIGNGTVEVPEIITDYIYNGTEITFVPENNAYTVKNGTQVNAGTYDVVVTLKDGYLWSDGTKEPKEYTIVIRPVTVEKPVFPSTNIYTYDDTIRGVVIPESDGYTVNGITQTKEPGTYKVSVSLNQNYVWSDNTKDTLVYVYEINRILVEIPAQIDSVFRFTGTDVTYPIVDTVDYYIVTGHHRTTAGLHYVTVTLSDTLHYVWSDLTTDPKIYEFWIEKYKVDLPVAIIDSFVYDSTAKLFEVVSNENYTVERINGAGIEIGVYERRVSLVDTVNFLWADGTVEDKIVRFYITKDVIPTILVPSDLVYTGEVLELIKPSRAYTLVNNEAINAGVYDVEVIPNKGYTWPDSTKYSKTYSVRVLPKMVNIPTNNHGGFLYNGKPQTFEISIPSDSTYTVTGNVQTEVGNYEVVVALKDSMNYCWSDSTHSPKIYNFIIENSMFYVSQLSQSNNMAQEATPGHIATFDLSIVGRAYQYCITCDSCPAFNVDTTDFDSQSFTFDILIPDTVKPGVYNLKVSFISGTLIKTQEVELKVNYPATDIYMIWDDVLTVTNADGLFETYQWYKNGMPIEGATKQYYQENEGLDGYYMCLVNNELFVGPLFFHVDKPLWIKAYGGHGNATVDVIGNIPADAKVGVYSISGYLVEEKDAESNLTFDLAPNSYIVRLFSADPTVKISTQSVKILVQP